MTLHRRLPKEVFIDPETGDHWDLSQDMAVYLPMLELAGNHAKHLYRITCTYNLHAASDHMQARPAQLEAEQRIRETPSCQPLDELSPHLSTPSD
jgi:hypothetical protein